MFQCSRKTEKGYTPLVKISHLPNGMNRLGSTWSPPSHFAKTWNIGTWTY